MKFRIGILMGGISREREISFAGGRTVYDNLNKDLFEAVPLFLDSTGQLIVLNWPFLYKGTIRDFYPPVSFLPPSVNGFQVYAESILDSENGITAKDMACEVGNPVTWESLPHYVDFVFLCLHGPFGEDGRVQGLLEQIGLPYSGSGVFASSVGIDKGIQKKLMSAMGFDVPAFFVIDRDAWCSRGREQEFFKQVVDLVGQKFVVKSACQGSSIGISILENPDFLIFQKAVNKAFFREHISASDWHAAKTDEKIKRLRDLTDIRSGLGFPIFLSSEKGREKIFHPEKLLLALDQLPAEGEFLLESEWSETSVVIEAFVSGREFSCIVIDQQTENGDIVPLALPPTEITKSGNLFDYRSKYLPGLARKVTPIALPLEEINHIASACEKLYVALGFEVYARIDGFYTPDGKVFLNDPNTTSGMMPSSFFFHQAAEIGLNPSQFLTFIIHASLRRRLGKVFNSQHTAGLLYRLNERLAKMSQEENRKTAVGVILGGYSSERHISVESGRNIFEKLSSSSAYTPVPLFLTGDASAHRLFRLPITVLLKDNADDIRDKVLNWQRHSFIEQLLVKAHPISKAFGSLAALEPPCEILYEELPNLVHAAFIALHGRPGEDGAVQSKLDAIGLPYNGSGPRSSSITINKFETNEILRKQGLLVANHMLVNRKEWIQDAAGQVDVIARNIGFPLIAKPVDDGCSSAVRKINSREDLMAFAKLLFRSPGETLDIDSAGRLGVKGNEEFPFKEQMLIEELISRGGAEHFLEITGGLLTTYDQNGKVSYEVFEASEALAEGAVLSLEEKFLAGEGQNITPARYDSNPEVRQRVSEQVKDQLRIAAGLLNIEGYARIDAFVRVFSSGRVEVIFIEVNSLPGMTPATCIFHQTALQGYKPYEFIDRILKFGFERKRNSSVSLT